MGLGSCVVVGTVATITLLGRAFLAASIAEFFADMI
jgi:hypothetical protein